MVVTTPLLGLPKGQGSDSARDYLKGAIAGGGLWKALEILDNAILSTGSVTLTNPILVSPTIADFTNAQHAHSSAATAGSTLGPGTTLSTPSLTTPAVSGTMTFGGDATVQRTGAGALRVDTHLGVGLNPAAWNSAYRAVDVGASGALVSDNGFGVYVTNNAYVGAGGGWLARTAGAAGLIGVGPTTSVMTAPSAAAGGALTFTTRASIAPTGTLTLTPDAGQAALSSGTGSMLVTMPGGFFGPPSDNGHNLGGASNRWTAVYATNGTIQTSSQDFKEGITPLSPERAMQAVRDTEAVTFDYVAPARGPEWYDLPDDPEQAQKVLEDRLTAAPLEAAARHQHGFVAEQCDPLFLVGEGQTSPGSSIGVLLAAQQGAFALIDDLVARVTALEGAA